MCKGFGGTNCADQTDRMRISLLENELAICRSRLTALTKETKFVVGQLQAVTDGLKICGKQIKMVVSINSVIINCGVMFKVST